jgi:hypothetical protein
MAWIVARLIGFGGHLVESHAGVLPLTGGWLAWLASIGSGLGEWMVFAVWLLVTALVTVIGLIVAASLPKRNLAVESGVESG